MSIQLGVDGLYEETWGQVNSIPEPDPSAEHIQSRAAIAEWEADEKREKLKGKQRREFGKGAAAAFAVATISPERGEKAIKPDLHEPSQQFIESIEPLIDQTPEELASKLVEAWVTELNEVHKLGDRPNFEKYIIEALSNYIKMTQGVVVGSSGTFSSAEIMNTERWHATVITFAALIEGTIQKAKDHLESENGEERTEQLIFDENGDISEDGKYILITEMILKGESDFRVFLLAETFGIVNYHDLPSEVDRNVYTQGLQRATNTLVGSRRSPFLKTPKKNDYHSLFDHDKINAHLGSISSGDGTRGGTTMWIRHGLKANDLNSWKDIVQNKVIQRNVEN